MNKSTRRKWRQRGDAGELRARHREYQRRRRARLYAAGLTSDGTPPVRCLYMSADKRAALAHPSDCLCRDCLFPQKPAEYQPLVHRVGVE